MKKKTKKIPKRKVLKRIRKIRNPENTETEQDQVDAFFAEIHSSKRIEEEMKYRNNSVIEICDSLKKNLNDEMYYDTLVDYMHDINGLMVKLNRTLGIK